MLEHYDRIREIHNPENANKITTADRTKLEALGGCTHGRLYAALQACFIRNGCIIEILQQEYPRLRTAQSLAAEFLRNTKKEEMNWDKVVESCSIMKK